MGKKAEAGRDIAQTLSELNIDDDLDPADAAREQAEAVASSVDVEEVNDFDKGEETPDAPPATTAEAEVVVPKPQPIPEDDSADEEVALPLPAAFVPPPRAPKPKKPQPAGKGMPKGLMDKAPGAAKVKVYKREKGQRWFISDFVMDDLANFPDFESFLTRYIKDDHGPGEYDLVGVDAGNREIELGTVRLRGTPDKKESTGAMELMKIMMERSESQNEQYLAQMREVMKPRDTTDPLAMLAGVMQVQEKLSGNAEAKAAEAKAEVNDAMHALTASSDRSMQMLMAMMQQSAQQQAAAAQQQQQMLMAVLSKPKEEDPVMKMLLMKLMEEKEAPSAAALPPPPPPPKPTEGLSDILTAMAAFMGAMGGGGGDSSSDDDFKEFLKAMLLKQESNGLSTKDAIELLSRKEEKGGGLKSAIDDLAAVMNVAQNINRSQEGGPAAGLFDALAALFSNRDFAGSIANTIRAKVGQGEAIQRTALEAERQRLALQARMAHRTAELSGHNPQPIQQTQQPQQQVQQVQQQPFAQPGPPNAPQAAFVAGPTAADVQAAAESYVQRTGKPLPELPALTMEHIQNLATAADEGELVGKTVAMLIYFAEFDDWRAFSEQLLTFVRNGNKGATREYVTAFFDGLAEIHMIEPSLAKQVVTSLITHFDAVKQQLLEFSAGSDGEITGEDLMAAQEDEEEPEDDAD